MSKTDKSPLGFFERYLSIWVLLCMGAGILLGKFIPGFSYFFGRLEIANINIPIAILIWLWFSR
jgi:ACR3 family arsenite transporter